MIIDIVKLKKLANPDPTLSVLILSDLTKPDLTTSELITKETTTMFPLKQTETLSIGLLLLVTVALIGTACTPSVDAAVAASPMAANQNNSGITVVGMGEAAGQPDEARVTVGVDTFAKNVNVATAENEENIQAILAALQSEGITGDDIQTSNYSLWAEQLYGENGPEGIAGYRVSNQVNVTIRDIEKVGDVITAAINAGANQIYGVNFTVADPIALEAEARQNAVNNARERAQSLAELSGVTLGDVQSVNELYTQMNAPVTGLGGGGEMLAQSSISPGQLSYHVQVQVNFGMK